MARLSKPHIPEATRAREREHQRRHAEGVKRLARALLFYAGSAKAAREALAEAIEDYDAVHNPRRRGRPPAGNLAVLLAAFTVQQREGCGKRAALKEALRFFGQEPTAKSVRRYEDMLRGRTLADFVVSLLQDTENPG